MIIAINAEISDKPGDLFDGRDLSRNTIDFSAPAGTAIGRHHRIGDVGQPTEIGFGDLVADVEDDDVLIAGMRLDPFGIYEWTDVGSQRWRGEEGQREG